MARCPPSGGVGWSPRRSAPSARRRSPSPLELSHGCDAVPPPGPLGLILLGSGPRRPPTPPQRSEPTANPGGIRGVCSDVDRGRWGQRSACVPGAGSTWRSLDAPEPGWTEPGFDDATWLRGPAQLGVAEADHETELQLEGPSVALRHTCVAPVLLATILALPPGPCPPHHRGPPRGAGGTPGSAVLRLRARSRGPVQLRGQPLRAVRHGSEVQGHASGQVAQILRVHLEGLAEVALVLGVRLDPPEPTQEHDALEEGL